MNNSSLNIIIFGLSITSSWGNGHATTYRSLVKGLVKKGHNIIFFERDVPWYAANRDLPEPPHGKTVLYNSIDELKKKYLGTLREADLIIAGSYVPEGVNIGNFLFESTDSVIAFYDIDTPVTLAKLKRKDYEYISPEQIKKYDIYLSFSGGPILNKIENEYESPLAKPFYCSFDPDFYYPEDLEIKWDLGYLGTYSEDRQPALNESLIKTAYNFKDGKFIIAGPNYPDEIELPGNVQRINHIPPSEHRNFYNSQKFTLNITRSDMIEAGFSPSVRLFEAAACAVPVISDYWVGLESFFEVGKEILISRSSTTTLEYLHNINEKERTMIGNAARNKVLSFHTADHRAEELENYYYEAAGLKL